MKFSQILLEEQLVAGFVVALNSFSSALIGGEQYIESIKMSELQLFISYFKEYILVLIVNKYENSNEYESFIINLEKRFLEIFGLINEDQVNQTNIFDSFEPIVRKITRSHITFSVVQDLKNIKNELWKYFSQLAFKTDRKDFFQTNMIQIDQFPELPNCSVSFINVDIEQSLGNMLQFLEDKHIIIIVVIPTLSYIKTLIPRLVSIKERKKKGSILGIYLKNYGNILKENCEALLNLRMVELNLNDSDTLQKLYSFVINCVLGKISGE